MLEFGKSLNYIIYDGAVHAFMRRGDDPNLPLDDPNKKVRNLAWNKLLSILRFYK